MQCACKAPAGSTRNTITTPPPRDKAMRRTVRHTATAAHKTLALSRLYSWPQAPPLPIALFTPASRSHINHFHPQICTCQCPSPAQLKCAVGCMSRPFPRLHHDKHSMSMLSFATHACMHMCNTVYVRHVSKKAQPFLCERERARKLHTSESQQQQVRQAGAPAPGWGTTCLLSCD